MSDVRSIGNGLVRKIAIAAQANEVGDVADVALPALCGSLLGLRKRGPAASVAVLCGEFDYLGHAGIDLPHGRCARLVTTETAGLLPDIEQGDDLRLRITPALATPYAHFSVELLITEDVDGVEDALLAMLETM